MTQRNMTRVAGLQRSQDPAIRAKVGQVVDACDQALEEARYLLDAVEGVLHAYDSAYNNKNDTCGLHSLRNLNCLLTKMMDHRQELNREEYITELAGGKLGAEIAKMGEKFDAAVLGCEDIENGNG